MLVCRSDTIQVGFKGTAGQAFGAWLTRGITFDSKAKATTMSARACPVPHHRQAAAQFRHRAGRTPSSSATP